MGSLPCFNLTIKENSEWFIVHWKSSRPPVFCSSVTGVFWSIDCKILWWPGVSGGPPPAPSVCSILHTHLSPSYPGSLASSDGKIILLLPAITTSAIGRKLLKSWSTSLDYFAAEWFQLLIFHNQRQHYYVEISLSWAVAWIRSWQHVTAQHRQR